MCDDPCCNPAIALFPGTQLNAFCLNFHGRVTQASVKNFQLVTDNLADKVYLQFGKVHVRVAHEDMATTVDTGFQGPVFHGLSVPTDTISGVCNMPVVV